MEIVTRTALPLPAPRVEIAIRPGTRDDIAFMDRLQKMHGKALGFFPRAQMEGYIDNGWVLVAIDSATGEKLGYVASRDRYLKRDELGVVYQLCVTPGRERGFIGANLLKEVFERSSYGCRLYCCWCAQDLPANRFWEAMGFVPVAYRAGSMKKKVASGQWPVASEMREGAGGASSLTTDHRPLTTHAGPRIHIFWQKRIRAGDRSTPFWFPAKTEGGAIRADRIILPIPPGMQWWEALPVLETVGGEQCAEVKEKKKASRRAKAAPGATLAPLVPTHRAKSAIQFGRIGAKARTALEGTQEVRVVQDPPATQDLPAVQEKKPREKRKADPALVAKSRELRDRYLEQVNAQRMLVAGKYDVARVIETTAVQATNLLAA